MSQIYEALKRSEKDGTAALLAPEKKAVTSPPTTETASETATAFEEQTLVAVPSPKKPLVALTDEHSLAGEKFRILANRIAYISRNQKLKVIQITSAVAGEGKSVVAANLAVMLSRRQEERVLLIEGDVHRPSQISLFGLPAQPGLGEWWEQARKPLPKLFHIDALRLWLLPAGVTKRTAAMLQSAKLPQLLKDVREMFDWVIIDAPPMLPLADTNLWARWSDGTLLVIREGMTPKKALQKGLDSLDNPKIIGVVLNEATEGKRVQYYAQYYGARKLDAPSAREKSKK